MLIKNKKHFEKCEERIEDLHQKFDEIKIMLSKLIKPQDGQPVFNHTETADQLFFKELPIKTADAFANVEKELQNEDVFNNMVRFLFIYTLVSEKSECNADVK